MDFYICRLSSRVLWRGQIQNCFKEWEFRGKGQVCFCGIYRDSTVLFRIYCAWATKKNMHFFYHIFMISSLFRKRQYLVFCVLTSYYCKKHMYWSKFGHLSHRLDAILWCKHVIDPYMHHSLAVKHKEQHKVCQIMNYLNKMFFILTTRYHTSKWNKNILYWGLEINSPFRQTTIDVVLKTQCHF